MNVNIFVVNVMDQIRKACEASGCELPVGVSFDVGLSAYGEEIDVTGSDGARVKFSLPFLHNVHVDASADEKTPTKKSNV